MKSIILDFVKWLLGIESSGIVIGRSDEPEIQQKKKSKSIYDSAIWAYLCGDDKWLIDMDLPPLSLEEKLRAFIDIYLFYKSDPTADVRAELSRIQMGNGRQEMLDNRNFMARLARLSRGGEIRDKFYKLTFNN